MGERTAAPPVRRARGVWAAALVCTLGCAAGERPLAPKRQQVAFAVPSPSHGGTIAVLQGHSVELLAHRSGEVFARVLAHSGQQPGGPALLVAATVRTREGSGAVDTPVLLRWHEGSQQYRARVPEPIVEGPATITLLGPDRVDRGRLAHLPVSEALEDSGVALAQEMHENETDERDPPPDGLEPPDESEERTRSSRRSRWRTRARQIFGL